MTWVTKDFFITTDRKILQFARNIENEFGIKVKKLDRETIEELKKVLVEKEEHFGK